MWFPLIAAVLIAALIYKLFLSSSGPSVWKKLGVHETDISKVASSLDLLLGRKPLTDLDVYVYNTLGPSQKFSGIIEQGHPVVVVKDLDLAKKILIKDFDHFMDRRRFFDEHEGSLGKTLLSLEGEEWKGVRSTVSPTFTTGKIRRMMEYFNTIGKEWVDELRSQAGKTSDGSLKIDVTNCVNQYTIDVISSTVFGMNAGAVKNPKSQFAHHANVLSNVSAWQMVKLLLKLQFPLINRILGLKVVNQEALTFFEAILLQGLKQRLSGEAHRNDFLQLLVEAQKGELKAAGSDELDQFEKDAQINMPGAEKGKKQYLTNEVMNAQSVLFFFAGFSTTSSVITFALYALSLHQDVQETLRKEVKKIVKGDGTFDYDELNKLVYLDMVLSETIRKFPPVNRLERVCTRQYKDPEIGLVVPKGARISIPVDSIHGDKAYYDNPDAFDPEHFSPDKKTARNQYAYLGFGVGPRNCLGMRFALVGTKAAIAQIVLNFLVQPPKTPTPLQKQTFGIQHLPPKDLELKLTPIKS